MNGSGQIGGGIGTISFAWLRRGSVGKSVAD